MSYGYDNASQLTGITYTNGGTTLGTLTYAYDLAGRRTQMGGSYAQIGLPLGVSEAEYNANNQLTEWGTASLFYDANGNMTSDGVNSFNWNARNQMSSMNASAVSFQYDPYGRRAGKTVAGITTNYLYDGANIAQEISGGSPIANLLSGGIDEVFTRTDSSGTANFLTDALGSTINLTNSSGSSLAQYAYEPFGNTTVTSGSSTNSYEYTGRENDGAGLYFYRARYFNPSMQRFISEDPLQFGANSVNFYEYTYDSPLDYKDPSGKQLIVADPVSVGVATGAAATTGAAVASGAGGSGPVLSLIAGGSGAGSSAGPIGALVGTILVVGAYDANQIYKLGVASGWWPGSGSSPAPCPAPGRNPVPGRAPSGGSGPQSLCRIQSVGPGYCVYSCDDGTTVIDESCEDYFYKDRGKHYR